MIGKIIGFGAIVWAGYFMASRRAKVPEGQVSQEGLVGVEKLQVWLVCIFSPLISGAILYYGLRKKLPVMATQVNKISFIAFGVEFLLGVALAVLFLNGHTAP